MRVGILVNTWEAPTNPNEVQVITTIYFDDPWLRWDRNMGGKFRLRYDTQQRIDRVTGAYLRNEVEGDYTQTLEVRDPSLTRDAPDSLELPWSHGSVA